jgi:hypothetical protein
LHWSKSDKKNGLFPPLYDVLFSRRYFSSILYTDEERATMSKVSLNVQKQFCEECSLALRRFVGGMEGVETIEVQKGKIEIGFDSSKITEDFLKKLAKDSIEISSPP